MRKKASTPISIGILVILTIGLVFYTLLMFNIGSKAVHQRVLSSVFLNDIYIKEETVNYYLNGILEKAVSKGADNLEENLKSEIMKYKINGKYVVAELGQAESQTGRVRIKDNKALWDVEIEIKSETEGIFVDYKYVKTFEKVFK